MKTHLLLRAGALAALLAPTLSHATNGYFQHGYGVRSQGIAGIGVALPQDALAAASNPAGTAFLGERVDLGLTWFVPERGAEITGGNLFGADGKYSGNDRKHFFIPEFGYLKPLPGNLTAGIAVYGNGGMNTDYARNPFAAFGGTGKAGVNFEQLFVTPSLAWKISDRHAIGAAVNFAWQRFEAKGLGGFAPASAFPNRLTNRGTDTAVGWGLRLGWTGQVTDTLTLGASWTSKIKTDGFDKYKGLFAEGGGFDVPESWSAGAAWKALPALTLAAELQEIKYSDVDSVGNPLAYLFAGNALGSSNGAGFGWRDVTVVKLGASYDLNPDLTLRVGYSHSDNPIPRRETLFNILAPGVVQDHLTFGATWKVTPNGELSLAYAHAFRSTVHGSNSIPPGFPPGFGGGEANLHLKEDMLGVAWSWKL